MIPSSIHYENGRVHLYIDGVLQPACAYITYFDERSRCQDFAAEGYEIFSLCAYFSGLPLNSTVAGFSPHPGFFDIKGQPDYSVFDAYVKQIADACPTAKIFPRVRVSMPQWWIDENPTEVCICAEGHKREALFSDVFRETRAQMLREFIAHVHASDYADHIIGYQIAGGCTEEWLHYDANGSFSPCSERKFNDYLKDHYPSEYDAPVALPVAADDPLMPRYLEFVNLGTAETLAYLAHVTKELVDHQQIVGAFYGYVPELSDPLRGAVGLHSLLHCPDIDFFCSPASYIDGRSLGIDWAEHCAGESIKQHGKLYFIENDIRTCLSMLPGESRPGIDPKWKYTHKVWLGPPTIEQSVWAVRKAYARQLTHANAFWWFDMWGGWYACPELLSEMKRCLSLMQQFTASSEVTTRSQVAVLFDEKLPFRMDAQDPCRSMQKLLHDRLGNTGMTFDALLTEDYAQSVHYEAVLLPFPASYDTSEILLIKEFLRVNQIPCLQLTADDFDISAAELRSCLMDLGVHCYCDSGDVIYHGNGYLAIHAATAGMKTITLPAVALVTPIDPCDGNAVTTDVIQVEMQEFETRLYRTEC